MATAIHAGHDLRADLRPFMALAEDERLREEDPYTDRFLTVADSTIRVDVSRFEVDLNRSRERAVYEEPGDAWGLDVWRGRLTQDQRTTSLALYDRFYKQLETSVAWPLETHPRVAVLDIHSYNHRRDGPNAPFAPAIDNPTINIGTGAADRSVWSGEIERFIRTMRGHPIDGAPLDVRENVKFPGGHMSRWLAERFGSRVLVLSIEIKKVFMDEWTGTLNHDTTQAIHRALAKASDNLRATLADA